MEEEEEKEEEKEVPSRGGESGVSHKRTLVCYCLSRGGYVVCVCSFLVSCFLHLVLRTVSVEALAGGLFFMFFSRGKNVARGMRGHIRGVS